MSGVATMNAEVSQIVWFDKDNLPEEEAFAVFVRLMEHYKVGS